MLLQCFALTLFYGHDKLCLNGLSPEVTTVINPLLMQIPHLRPTEYKRSRLSRNRRTVNRAYGGVLSGGAVRERFVLLNFAGLYFV